MRNAGKEIRMWNSEVDDRSNYWLRVFNNSKVNGAPYGGDNLPARTWRWPRETYLQRPLRWLRAHGGDHVGTADGVHSAMKHGQHAYH